MTCPTRTFFGPLRAVGARFCAQTFKNKDEDDVDLLLDDVVDFLIRALPDVLIERAIDISSMNVAPPDEDIYQMMEDYVPEENTYLAPDSSCRMLRADAAHRELHQVEPLYYEPDSEEEEEYASVAEYGLARDRPDSHAIYDSGMAGNALYDAASGGYKPAEAIYGLADAGDREDVYASPAGRTVHAHTLAPARPCTRAFTLLHKLAHVHAAPLTCACITHSLTHARTLTCPLPPDALLRCSRQGRSAYLRHGPQKR